MTTKIRKLFQEKIAICTQCRTPHNDTSFFNPYCESNPRHRSSQAHLDPLNRRNYYLDYLMSRSNVKVMIIGEAPGLDGCGYSGIAFTAEHNAVNDLGLTDHHRTGGNYQREESASVLYQTFSEVALELGCSISEFSSRIYMTNASLCVPLRDVGISVTSPSTIMKENCKPYLLSQIEALQPEYIITLGNRAFQSVVRIMEVAPFNRIRLKDIKTLSECIERNLCYQTHLSVIIPELHPSSQSKLNKRSKDLYPELKSRLKKKLLRIFSK